MLLLSLSISNIHCKNDPQEIRLLFTVMLNLMSIILQSDPKYFSVLFEQLNLGLNTLQMLEPYFM